MAHSSLSSQPPWHGLLFSPISNTDLNKCAFFRAAYAAGIDASSPLRHATNPCKTAIDFFGCVCRREHLVAEWPRTHQ
ncbi:MAG: hypothetical protein CR217_01470 [Beijerinckiaceae bacterium]|nr:MAG: hypothetical protein CR217_01470 [Beijerinckiaceae bacterium]